MNALLGILLAVLGLSIGACRAAPARSASPAPTPVVVPSAPAPEPAPVASAETPPPPKPEPPVPDHEAWLEHFDKQTGKLQVFPIQSGKVVRIGRASPDQALPDIDLGKALDGDTVSRRHAEIVQRDGSWMLFIQPDTTNRSFLNRELVERGSLTALKPGDEIQLGAVQVTFRAREPKP
jgi:hypothetical protein